MTCCRKWSATPGTASRAVSDGVGATWPGAPSWAAAAVAALPMLRAFSSPRKLPARATSESAWAYAAAWAEPADASDAIAGVWATR